MTGLGVSDALRNKEIVILTSSFKVGSDFEFEHLKSTPTEQGIPERKNTKFPQKSKTVQTAKRSLKSSIKLCKLNLTDSYRIHA